MPLDIALLASGEPAILALAAIWLLFEQRGGSRVTEMIVASSGWGDASTPPQPMRYGFG
jgi:hypothetical protein